MSLQSKLMHEFKKVALTTLYFFAGFGLLAIILTLLSPGSMDPSALLATVTLAALVVGKVVPLLETLMSRSFQRLGSFVATVLAKAALYTAAVLLALASEQVLHGLLDGLSPVAAWHEAMEAESGARFSARMLYLVALFSLYGFTLEVDRYLGHRSVRTTELYTHLTHELRRNAEEPLGDLTDGF